MTLQSFPTKALEGEFRNAVLERNGDEIRRIMLQDHPNTTFRMIIDTYGQETQDWIQTQLEQPVAARI